MNNKVIKVLDREHGKKVIEFWKQYCNTGAMRGDAVGDYYGIINGRFGVWTIDEVRKKNAEIIELQEEKTYPRVMLVSDDNINWNKRRVVFMEKCGKYIAWNRAETLEEAEETTITNDWDYAVELDWQPEEETKPLKLTMEQIAEKFNAEKIEIVNYGK